jgi:hypothetical protein
LANFFLISGLNRFAIFPAPFLRGLFALKDVYRAPESY